jgi:hypothetical protein
MNRRFVSLPRFAAMVGLLVATSPALANDAAPMTPAAAQSLLAAASPGSKVACNKDTYGNLACAIDGKAAELGDCTSNLSFGAIVGQPAVLQDRFTKADASPVATVGDHQLVCLQATVREQGRLVRALVKVVPSASVVYCKGHDLCHASDRPVTWHRPASGKACTKQHDGTYVGDCATGWVDGDAIEEYSMGLKPEDTGA